MLSDGNLLEIIKSNSERETNFSLDFHQSASVTRASGPPGTRRRSDGKARVQVDTCDPFFRPKAAERPRFGSVRSLPVACPAAAPDASGFRFLFWMCGPPREQNRFLVWREKPVRPQPNLTEPVAPPAEHKHFLLTGVENIRQVQVLTAGPSQDGRRGQLTRLT